MAVPKLSQLHPNVDVNIVLKSNQSSGKLTVGRISEILTRGDHPRGIKVRLTDGRVGRVQSLSEDPHPTNTAQTTSSVPMSNHTPSDFSEVSAERSLRFGHGERNDRVSRRGDYGGDPNPLQSRSLADYIKVPPSSKIAPVPQIPVQAQLEKDFPKLDTALIAAILTDYEDVDTARSVLGTLS